MKRKIVGASASSCPECGKYMTFIQINKAKVMSQCKSCGCLMDGRVKDKVKIFEFDLEGEQI